MSLGGTAAYRDVFDLPDLVRDAVTAAIGAGFDFSCRPPQGRLLALLAAGVSGGVIGETGTGCGVGLAWLPNEYPVKSSRPVIGGMLGARMSEHWAAEARAGYLKSPGKLTTDPTLSFFHVEGNVTLFLSGDRPFTPYLTGGAGQNYLHSEGTGSSLHRFTLNGGVGFRRRLGERVALRLDTSRR